MSGRQIVIIVLVVLLVLLLLGHGQISAADPPPVASTQPNPDLFQYQGQSLQKYSADNAQLKRDGVWRWRFVSVPGCNSESIRPAVVAGFSQMSRYGMTMIQADGDPTAHAVYATCGSQFAAVCGGPPVIGCLGRGFPYNNDIDISTDMAAFYDVSQRAIALHELHHATFVWNEQYRLDGSFGSSNDVTIMNTGPLSRHDLGLAEDARVWRTMGSPELKRDSTGYAFSGAWYVWACNFDANATRLAVLVDRHDGNGIIWSGVSRAIPTDSSGRKGDANGCLGVGVYEGLNIVPGHVYYLKQESPSSFRVSFNEACVRGSVGC